MSTITAPSYPPSQWLIGKGFVGANGHSLNIFGEPLPNYLSQDLQAAGMTAPISITGSTTLFDVSSLTENHEVVCMAYNSSNTLPEGANTNYTIVWYRSRDNAAVWNGGSFNLTTPWTGKNSLFLGWMGWLSENINISTYPQYREVQENGNYYVVMTASGAENFSQTINFAVKGMPANTVLRYPTSTGFEYTVRTSNYFDATSYIRVGIATSPVSDGSSSPPSGILSSIYPPSSSVGCAAVGTVAGLEASTTYTLYGFAQAANGLYYSAGSFTNTTTYGKPPKPSAPVDFSSRIEGGFNLFWGTAPSEAGTLYELGYKPAYLETWTTVNLDAPTRTLTGLQYGVTYDFRVRAWNLYGFSDYTVITSWTTAPKTPSISTGIVTGNSITINAGSMSGNYDEIQIQRYTSGSVYIDEKYCQAGGSVTWNSLSPGATYIFKARSKFYINSINLYSVNFSNNLTVVVKTRPDNWSWITPKTSGDDFDLTSEEWNSFTARIDLFRTQYKGLTSYGFTTAPYDDGKFYAFMFNQARNAINEMNPPTTVPTTQFSGNDVYASLLNGLRDSLNSIV